MFTPNLKRKSVKLTTPQSVYGIRQKKETADTGTNVPYEYRPERLRFSITASQANAEDDSEEDDSEGLEELLRRTWRVYKVSPLHNFQYTSVSLKQYGRRMREGLSTSLTDSKKETSYDVIFSVAKGISLTRNDNKSVKIEVNAVTLMNGADRVVKHFVAYLICRNASRSFQEESVIHLPILLCRGAMRTENAVNRLLGQYFDCSISALELTQLDFVWITALETGDRTWKKLSKTATVSLIFAFPQLSVKNSVCVQLPVKTLTDLWERIHDRNSEDATYEEVMRYNTALQKQISRLYGFDIEYGQLLQIKSPGLNISNDTRLRATKCEIMSRMLRFLYENSTIIESSNPSLSIQPG